MNMHITFTSGFSAVTTGLVVGALMVVPSAASAAEVDGTSDTTVICEGARAYDPDVYEGPGIVCDVDGDTVEVDGRPHDVITYRLHFKLKGAEVGTNELPGPEPAPALVTGIQWEFGSSYDVSLSAVLDNGDTARLIDDDFHFDTPGKPGKPKVKRRYGQLNQGIGAGYNLQWSKIGRAEGYQAQARKKGQKFHDLELTANRKSEYGLIKPAKKGQYIFRARTWNAAGYGPWGKVKS